MQERLTYDQKREAVIKKCHRTLEWAKRMKALREGHKAMTIDDFITSKTPNNEMKGQFSWVPRVLLSLYILWVGLNLIFFLLGTPTGIYINEIGHGRWDGDKLPIQTTNVKKVFFPFRIAYYDVPAHEELNAVGRFHDVSAKRVYLTRVQTYDYTEFVLYTVLPLILYFAVIFLIPKNIKPLRRH